MKKGIVVKKWIYYALLLLVCGCSSEKKQAVPEIVRSLDNVTVYASNTEPGQEVSLEKEVVYKDTDEVKLGRILGNVTVDSRGRIYIPDYQMKAIHVYDANGSYLDRIGMEGRGPGEFQMIWKLRIANDHLHVLDYMHQKISVFDLQTLQHVRDLPLSIKNMADKQPSWLVWTRENNLFYRPINFYVRSDENYLIFFGSEDVGSGDNLEGRTYEVSVFDPTEQVFTEHDFLSFEWTGQTMVYEDNEGMTVFRNVPYMRSSRFAHGGNKLIYGWTEDKLFRMYDGDGNYQRAFYHSKPEIPLEVEDVLAQYQNIDEQTETAIRNDTLPETWPAFDAMILDDEGRLWISTFSSDPNIYQWLVFNVEDGRQLAQFEWPRSKQIEQIKNGKVYARETDEETGLEEVVRYRINID